MSWFFGSEQKTTGFLRDETYCEHINNLNDELLGWKKGSVRTHQALENADYHIGQIQKIGRVDAERARDMLSAKGISDERRLELQVTYQELKRVCGQRVPKFDSKGSHRHDVRW